MRKPVLLIGMMGCGKSTVGRLLAERMRLPLIDLDEEIARAAGKTIPEIFAQEGEAGFRARETAALERALAREDGVIATGGGIVTRAENIRTTSFPVWMQLSSAAASFSGGWWMKFDAVSSSCARGRQVWPLPALWRRVRRRAASSRWAQSPAIW